LAHFFCFPFDQGEDASNASAKASLWVMRTVAVLLFVLNIIVNYRLEHDVIDEDVRAGRGGYMTLNEFPHDVEIWLALLPNIILSLLGITMAVNLYRYGNNLTMGLVKNNSRWAIVYLAGKTLRPSHFMSCIYMQNKYLYLYTTCFCNSPFTITLAFSSYVVYLPVFLLVAGQIPGTSYYSVTSNAGELALLIGLTRMLQVVQDELYLTAGYAEFLHRSNLAFKSASAQMTSKSFKKSDFSGKRGSFKGDGEVTNKDLEKPENPGYLEFSSMKDPEGDSKEDNTHEKIDLEADAIVESYFMNLPSASESDKRFSPRPSLSPANSPTFRIELYEEDGGAS
jgi:hypothetical protein